MKQIILVIMVIILCNFCACSNNNAPLNEDHPPKSNANFKNDDEIALTVLEALVNAEDVQDMEYLFAQSAIQTENFYTNAEAFIAYIEGQYIDHEARPISVDTSRIEGQISHIIRCAFKIYTTTTEYHIYFNYCGRNDADSEEIGIQSLSIISAKQWGENNPVTYRGNGNWSPGIHIDENNIEDFEDR